MRPAPSQGKGAQAGKSRTAAVVAALFLLAGSAVLSNTILFRQSLQGTTDLTRGIPARLGPWELLEEEPATPSEIRGLETRDIIKRRYGNGKDQMELVVAHIARSSRKSAHAQEACLRGAGALVGSIRSVRMERSPVKAKVISIDFDGRRDWVYYWYKMGGDYSADYLGSSLKMFLRGLSGSGSGGTTLVRLLTPEGKGETSERIAARVEDFTFFLIPELGKRLP